MDDFQTQIFFELNLMEEAMEGMVWTVKDALKLAELANDLGDEVLSDHLLKTEIPLEIAFNHAIEELVAIGFIELKDYEATKKKVAESRTGISFAGHFASADKFIFIKKRLGERPKSVSAEQEQVIEWALVAFLVGDPRCYREPEDIVDMAGWAIELHEKQRKKEEREKLERKKKALAKSKAKTTKTQNSEADFAKAESVDSNKTSTNGTVNSSSI